MPLTAAEKQKRYRERLKQNVDRYEEAKKKHREHYHKVKRLVKDLTSKEKKNANIIWKLRQRRYRDKKKALQSICTPPSSPVSIADNEQIVNVAHINALAGSESPKTRGRRKVKKDRSKVYRENQKLRDEVANLKRKCEKYKKRVTRSKQPKKKTQDDSEPRRNYALLTNSIKERYAKIKSRKDKKLFKSIFNNTEVSTSRQKMQLLRETLGIKREYSGSVTDDTKNNTVLQNKINEFFLRDDVSRASAGKKETVTRHGEKIQKRYLLDTMRRLHKNFINESDMNCSYYYFTNNRPFYVVPQSVEARETCVCKMHANFMFKFKALKTLGILKSDDVSEVIQATVCSDQSKDCMYSNCSRCRNNKIVFEKISNTNVNYMQWVRKEIIEDGKKKKKSIKEAKTNTVTEFIREFKKYICKFKKHIFNIKTQFKCFRDCLNNLNANECVIVVDFSENYAGKYNEEVQEHHFGGSRKQVSLHTVMVYTFDFDKNYTPHSFCTVSSSVCHEPHAIWAHLKPILEWVKQYYRTVDTIHFFSDGPSTQYRQKKNFFLFATHFYDFGFLAGSWNFFEAGHGKGPADGIGGFLKRTADKMVTLGKDIPDAIEFYKQMKESSKITLYFIEKQAIEEMQKKLPKIIKRLVGTLQVHQVATNERNLLKYRSLSCFCECTMKGFCNCYDPKLYQCGTLLHTQISLEPEHESSEDDIPLSVFKALRMEPSSSKVLKNLNGSSDGEDVQYQDLTSPIEEPQPSASGIISQNECDQVVQEPEEEFTDDDILAIFKEVQNLPSCSGIYKTIYGSSDDEEECPYVGKENLFLSSDIDTANLFEPQTSATGLVSRNAVSRDDFLLVYVPNENDMAKKKYSYVCKVLAHDDELNELWVMFVRALKKNEKLFRLEKTDVHLVPYEDVIRVLPAPVEVKKGDKVFYKFKHTVNVNEK